MNTDLAITVYGLAPEIEALNTHPSPPLKVNVEALAISMQYAMGVYPPGLSNYALKPTQASLVTVTAV